MKKHEQVGIRTEKTNEELWKQGTNEAITELWLRIEPWVRATARRQAGARGLPDYIDDLVGETQVRLVQLRGVEASSVQGLLVTVIRNLARDEVRRRASPCLRATAVTY